MFFSRIIFGCYNEFNDNKNTSSSCIHILTHAKFMTYAKNLLTHGKDFL